MKQYNGTGTLFLVAIAIIGIILFVAMQQYDLDYISTAQMIFTGVK